MQLRNIRPHSQFEPGDVVEVPDGAAFDPFHWEPVDLADVSGEPAWTPLDPPLTAPAAAAPRLPYPAKEM